MAELRGVKTQPKRDTVQRGDAITETPCRLMRIDPSTGGGRGKYAALSGDFPEAAMRGAKTQAVPQKTANETFKVYAKDRLQKHEEFISSGTVNSNNLPIAELRRVQSAGAKPEGSGGSHPSAINGLSENDECMSRKYKCESEQEPSSPTKSWQRTPLEKTMGQMQTATWRQFHLNIRALTTDEKMEELLAELEGVEWDAVTINETWRTSKEEIECLKSKHVWYGSGGSAGKHGVGLLLHKKWAGQVERFDAISPRLAVLVVRATLGKRWQSYQRISLMAVIATMESRACTVSWTKRLLEREC